MEKPLVKITIMGAGTSRKTELALGRSLQDAMLQAGVFLPAPCGGRGRCGKCRIRLLNGELPITEGDRSVFTERELSQGWRLACCAYPTEDVTVWAEGEEGPMDILAMDVSSADLLTSSLSGESSRLQQEEEIMFCVDVGTTTLAMTAMNREGKAVCSYTSPNRQRGIGADVLSRIEGVSQGQGRLLQQLIREDLIEGIETLWKRCGHPKNAPLILAGNTTMVYLLMGWDPRELGSYPFTASHTEEMELPLGELLPEIRKELRSAKAEILPGFSAFLGGDILADVLTLNNREESWLMVDLGTNAEMVLGAGGRLFGTSAAAGPALEGGNIRHGVAGIQGAISRVRISGRKAVIGTIGNSYPPVGICGTGALEAVASMLDAGILDETGALASLFSKEGYPLAVGRNGERILLCQQDIRNIQLAKSAIRVGIHYLLPEAGIESEDLSRIFLFGGLGNALSPEVAIRLGLLPKEFAGRVVHAGNGVLKGCWMWGRFPQLHREAGRLRSNMKVIPLAEAEGFGEEFVKYVDFDK